MSASSQRPEELSRRHPLQRLDSPSKGFSGAFHAVGLVSFYTCFKFLIANPNTITSAYGWHFQYLTIIGLAISTLSFASGLLADVTSSRQLFALKNYLALVAAPIEILISILYWSLRTISPSLVVPSDLPMLPLWNDLNFHLFPAILLSVDALLLSPPWPTSPVNPNAPLITLTSSTGLAFAYWFWIEWCYSYNGFYPYPIFELLSTLQRVGLFAISGATMWVVGSGLRVLYAYINGYERLDDRKGGKKI
ncbi:FAR-17a/AIG1-like protein [Dendryphion nanum]|uniref:FAR-17a/AIG1-like protein n=1 Tax=Dendryphion nanum TaxID=256645 RepID=A0A9P9IT82_9PLEO|nr:FAR-17a/AIG1-like protein [Dendryphion nanum]